MYQHHEIGKKCNDTSTINVTILEADEWDFAVDQNADGAIVKIFLRRYEYTVKSNSVLSSCIAGGHHPESCTVIKSMDATYLLMIGSGTADTVIDASVSCAIDGGALY